MRLIPVGNDLFTVVDDEDFAELSGYKWRHFQVGTGYVFRSVGHAWESHKNPLPLDAYIFAP